MAANDPAMRYIHQKSTTEMADLGASVLRTIMLCVFPLLFSCTDGYIMTGSKITSLIVGILGVSQPDSGLDYKTYIQRSFQLAVADWAAKGVTVVTLPPINALVPHPPCNAVDCHEAVAQAEALLIPVGGPPPASLIDALIASPCTRELQIQAPLSMFYNAKNTNGTLTMSPESPYARHISKYPHVIRVAYSTATQFDMFFKLCALYNWSNLSTIYDGDPDKSYGTIISDFESLARNRSMVVYSQKVDHVDPLSGINDVLNEIHLHARGLTVIAVVLLFATGDVVLGIMKAANALGMCNGSFAFFAWDNLGNDTLDDPARSAFAALQIFTINPTRYKDIITKYNSKRTSGKTATYAAITHYNALHMAVDIIRHIAEGNNSGVTNVGQAVQNYLQSHPDGYDTGTSRLFFQGPGVDFSEDMDLMDIQDARYFYFTPIATYNFNTSASRPSGTGYITWLLDPRWPGSTPPEDHPACGFDGAACHVVSADITVPTAAGGGGAVGLIFLIVFLGYLHIHQRAKKRARLVWLAKWNELYTPSTDPHAEARKATRDETARLLDEEEEEIEMSEMKSTEAEDREIYGVILPYGVYWKKKLYMSRRSSKYRLLINQKLLDEIQTISDLKFENLAKFEGACIEPDHVMIIYEYCAKGTFESMLLDHHKKLDWIIRFSLLHDMVKGLGYIHYSALNCHSRLTSKCCYVDARFVLKIADYGLPSFFELSVAEMWASKREVNYYADMLWTAPEQMRVEVAFGRNVAPPPTRSGDIYSFGIILQETMLRLPPFGMYGAMSAEEVVAEVKRPIPPGNEEVVPFRPILPEECASPALIEMAKRAWSQLPSERPSITRIKVMMRDLGKNLGFGEKGGILDTLLDQMDELMTNLQHIIEERSQQLLQEKIQSEELLYSLLPKPIAQRVKRNERIQPETFEMCTIELFCIDNFASITADYTTLQTTEFVMDFHNYLEQCMVKYDCLKIDFHENLGTVAKSWKSSGKTSSAAQFDVITGIGKLACMFIIESL
ncbi:hypothetical protein RvY_05786 [Ramazzottius varieornatus]|uniref:guanylate cyclase n=1 Tax=Ramazzottius varieornatus TaxID=947166 RepID=A0A1D1UW93_RAMVA|nr:hypothetical protein RvY_05786 [Ramazzottius varieornatus]